MSLLDFFNPQDDNQRAGLLAFAGSMLQPTVGGRFMPALSNGLMGYGKGLQEAQDREQQRKMQALQMQNLQAQTDLHTQQAALQKQKVGQEDKRMEAYRTLFAPPDKFEPQIDYRGASFSDAMNFQKQQNDPFAVDSPGPSALPMQTQMPKPTPRLLPQQTQDQAILNRLTPEVLAKFGMIDPEMGKYLLGLKETANKVHNVQPGWNINALTGEKEWTGRYAEGMQPGPGGSMMVQPGALQTMAALEAAKVNASEAAKFPYAVGMDRYKQLLQAGLDPVQVANPDGSMSYVPRATVVGQPQGVAPMPTAPGPMPAARGATDPNFPRADASWNQYRRPLIEEELNRAASRGDQKEVARLQRQLEDLPASDAALGGSPMAGRSAGVTSWSAPATGAPFMAKASPIAIEGRQALNNDWIKNSYRPVLEKGDQSAESLANISALRGIDLKTGFGTEAKGKFASVLSGLGIAPENAKMYASNVESFNSIAMTQLVKTFEAQKGVQTENDARRVQETYASLKNTPRANEFILDLAEAKARRDAKRADYYRQARPFAEKTGDFSEVDNRWAKVMPSVFDDPLMAKWKK